ncbi:glutamate-5-semialdehyde dehydrogenase, partial [Comamonas sp.]|uniref:glutamate-5-semialdehyde dehydrogenase n=1 Tax=Comamonas sp. TaxID=34028 RepID=UPI002FCB6D31
MNALNTVEYMHHLGVQAKAASALMASASAATKNKALKALARLLRAHVEPLQIDNAKDLERAVANGLAAPMVDRLRLTPKVLETCAEGCEQLAAMPDAIGEISGLRQMPSGIRVGQMRVPIGVFGMIYESRPNVTIEAASLSIKSGNACILRGGSEAIESNKALAKLVAQALAEAGLPENGVQLVGTTDRDAVGQLIAMPDYVDVIIPRGGKGLIERISREAKVPVIKHLDGNCHTYVDDPCDIAMAVKVADNAKTSKYSPCNASESLLVARAVAAEFLPQIGAVFATKGVEMRCDAEALAILQSVKDAKLAEAEEQDWYEEYLAPIISVKLVEGVDEAIAHINKYSSHHTESILTTNHQHAQ